MNIRHFRPSEVKGLDPKVVEMLDRAREIAGVPFRISSGYRSKASNSAVGGVSNSLHELGLAVDLRSLQGTLEREKTCFGLAAAGFKQIGLYNSHIHVEIDAKNNYAIWSGTSH